jgi:hypothetical protein
LEGTGINRLRAAGSPLLNQLNLPKNSAVPMDPSAIADAAAEGMYVHTVCVHTVYVHTVVEPWCIVYSAYAMHYCRLGSFAYDAHLLLHRIRIALCISAYGRVQG